MALTTGRPKTTTTLLFTLLLGAGIAIGGDTALVRIDRDSDQDRNALIDDGIDLVAETEDALIAIGSPAEIADAAGSRSLATVVVAEADDGARFALAALRPGFGETDLLVCGEVVTSGRGWHLIKGAGLNTPECLESSGWFLQVLDMDPLAPIKPPPAGENRLRQANPLVQEMVDMVDSAFALSHWSALSDSTTWTTRYSRSQGCIDASAYVHDLFTVFGLETEYQHHTTGYADNVIGTLTGSVEPEKTYIAIGHLDDLPSSGLAPGADDNASGTAMVTALAEIMSDYCFERTARFIAVTGEEQGLHGSDHYADTAAALGEDIQAVLNGDMIGWEGDGLPAVEDLDVNYNSGSQWLAQAMLDAAAIYSTNLVIKAVFCPTMGASDHAPFWNNGFSAICGITDNEGYCDQAGHYPYYHQSSDTIANCGPGGPDFEAAVIRTYLATMAELAGPIARIPDPPNGINASPDGDNHIALSWSDQGPGTTYQIYRSTGTCANPGPPGLIGDTSSSQFLDTSVSGGVPYAYTLAATVAGSCVSRISSCVEATTTGPCVEPPSFAGIESVVSSGSSSCRLDLSWQPPESVWCGGGVVYNVYRSTFPEFIPSPANRVTQTGATTFHDTDVVYTEDYTYIVRAVDLAHGGEDDNLHEVTSTPTGPDVIGTWFDDAGDTGSAKMSQASPWTISVDGGVNGSAAYATGTYDNNVCAALTTPPLHLAVGSDLEFWTAYDLENNWDKGEVQISTDGGASWERVPLTYPGSSSYTNDACDLGTGAFFTGNNPGYTAFTTDLSGWPGAEAQLRWILSTDTFTVGDGWWIDTISITDVAIPGTCITTGEIFTDGFESGDTSAW